ncbi:MAG: tetratricopeptide repeat protein, partial [Actinobacteria bacterium]|nr:tetratricopeptide repeat protein [Actinomycetota bacterium]
AAEAAHHAAYGGDFTVLHGSAARWPVPASCLQRIAHPDPLGWMEYEYENFLSAVDLSAQHGLTELSWDLAVTLVTLFEAKCLFEGWERTHRQAIRALQAAGAADNQRGLAALFCSMGSLHLARNEHSAAENALRSARAGFEATGDVLGQAMTLRNLALVERAQDAPERALSHLHSALRGFREVGDEIGDVHCLGLIAQVELESGDVAAAREHLTDALDRCRRVGNTRVEIQLRYRLARVLVLEGSLAEAAAALEELLPAVRENGDKIGEEYVLRLLADVAGRAGQPGGAGRPTGAGQPAGAGRPTGAGQPPATPAVEPAGTVARTGADRPD